MCRVLAVSRFSGVTKVQIDSRPSQYSHGHDWLYLTFDVRRDMVEFTQDRLEKISTHAIRMERGRRQVGESG